MTKNDVYLFSQWAQKRIESEDAESKLRYALSKVVARLRPVLSDLVEAWNDIDIDEAATDEKGILVKDSFGGYGYTKEGAKKRLDRRRAVLKETVEVKPFFVDTEPFNLTEDEKLLGTGFVFKQDDTDET